MKFKDFTINPIAKAIGKTPSDFILKDIEEYIVENEIRNINFRYVGGDGRLKELNFVIQDIEYLREILISGERVDGSSIFSFIDASSSDLYVLPRLSSAFMDPFAEAPTICFICNYYNKNGEPLDVSPAYILKRAHDSFKKVTGGMEFHAMGELEFYIIADKDNDLFIAKNQRGYHESAPFNKFEQLRCEAIRMIAETGAQIKYAHSEVGNFTDDSRLYEQTEIEFLPIDAELAVENLIIAKWIITNLAYQYGLDVTFAPKISTTDAGSGLHIHTMVVKDGVNCYIEDGKLSETAHRVIAGIMKHSKSLTAFGNTNPTSYLRLVPHQEAPTTVCWGDRNRSVLVRVPLGWTAKKDMFSEVNPLEKNKIRDFSYKQTVEFRCPDGSADLYLLLAGMICAARDGFEMENALQVAKDTYVDINIHKTGAEEVLKRLEQLPDSCEMSARFLLDDREVYNRYGVFTDALIESIAQKLADYNDSNIRSEIRSGKVLLSDLVKEFFYC